jgi:hypothetical protein
VSRGTRNTLIWSVIGVVLVLCAIVVLGAMTKPNGDAFLDSPGSVMASIIGSIALVAAATLPIVLKAERNSEESRSATARVAAQLENEHTNNPSKHANIRDDLDTKVDKDDLAEAMADSKAHSEGLIHELGTEIKRVLSSLDQQIRGNSEDIREARKDIGGIRSDTRSLDRRVGAVETKTNTIATDLAARRKDI